MWIRELFKISSILTSNRDDLLEVAETLLKRYFQECKQKFNDLSMNLFSVQTLIQSPALYSALKKDPSWIKIYGYDRRLASTEEYKNALETYVDKVLIESINPLKRDALLNKPTDLILLTNIHDSLEWLSVQINTISHWKYYKEIKDLATNWKEGFLKKKRKSIEGASTPMPKEDSNGGDSSPIIRFSDTGDGTQQITIPLPKKDGVSPWSKIRDQPIEAPLPSITPWQQVSFHQNSNRDSK
jgi:hypothetical protein